MEAVVFLRDMVASLRCALPLALSALLCACHWLLPLGPVASDLGIGNEPDFQLAPDASSSRDQAPDRSQASDATVPPKQDTGTPHDLSVTTDLRVAPGQDGSNGIPTTLVKIIDADKIVLWLDASDSRTITKNASGDVSEWRSSAAPGQTPGQTVVQPDTALQPKWVAEGLAGKPAVEFDGIYDWLGGKEGLNDIRGSDYAVIALASWQHNAVLVSGTNDAQTPAHGLIVSVAENDDNSAGRAARFLHRMPYSSNQTRYDDDLRINNSVTPNLPTLFVTSRSGTAAPATSNNVIMRLQVITKDSTASRTLTTSESPDWFDPNQPLNLTIGQSIYGTTCEAGEPNCNRNFNGHLAELIILKTALTGTQIDEIRNYFCAKWGLTC